MLINDKTFSHKLYTQYSTLKIDHMNSPALSYQVEGVNLKEAPTHISSEDIRQLKQLQCFHPLAGHTHPLLKGGSQLH